MTGSQGHVSVTSVEVVGDFVLRISFSDATARDIDLEDNLWGPMFEPLRADPSLFARVRVDHELGTIVWPNGADMDPVVLHGSAEPASKESSSRSRRSG